MIAKIVKRTFAAALLGGLLCSCDLSLADSDDDMMGYALLAEYLQEQNSTRSADGGVSAAASGTSTAGSTSTNGSSSGADNSSDGNNSGNSGNAGSDSENAGATEDNGGNSSTGSDSTDSGDGNNGTAGTNGGSDNSAGNGSDATGSLGSNGNGGNTDSGSSGTGTGGNSSTGGNSGTNGSSSSTNGSGSGSSGSGSTGSGTTDIRSWVGGPYSIFTYNVDKDAKIKITIKTDPLADWGQGFSLISANEYGSSWEENAYIYNNGDGTGYFVWDYKAGRQYYALSKWDRTTFSITSVEVIE